MYIYFSSVIDITAINFQTAQAQIYQQFSFLLEEIQQNSAFQHKRNLAHYPSNSSVATHIQRHKDLKLSLYLKKIWLIFGLCIQHKEQHPFPYIYISIQLANNYIYVICSYTVCSVFQKFQINCLLPACRVSILIVKIPTLNGLL